MPPGLSTAPTLTTAGDLTVHKGYYLIFTDHVFSLCAPVLPALRRIDLILVLWPICFVAATRQDPHLKPRDFKRSVETVAGVTGFTGITASLRGPLKRTMGDNGGRQIDVDATERQIERPYWETTSPETHAIDKLVSALGC